MTALAGKGQQAFMAAVRAPDAGNPVVQVAAVAVKIAADYLPHKRAKKSIAPAELFIIDLLESQ
jgi:hypothetical protein